LAPGIASALGAAGAAPMSAAALKPALASGLAAPSLSAPALSAPTAAALPALPAAAVPSVAAQAAAFAPAAPAEAAFDAAAAPAAVSGAALPADAPPAAAAEPSFPRGPDGKPLVLRSLKDLALLLGDGARLAGARTFDGAAARGPLVDPAGAAPSIPEGVTRVEAHPLRDGSDVDLIPRTLNSAPLHDELLAHLSSLTPMDIFVYHDARGGRFLGLDLSRNPDNAERLHELQPHEVATIRRIQAVTRDLQVLVREEGATPDLVVGGVTTEMKSVFRGDVAVQVAHANAQLLKHAERHGLGLGAIALDVRRELPVERVEAGIAAALRAAPAVGFAHVYAFNGGAWQTYARGADGEFRLARDARPFAAPAAAAHAALVPHALAQARLPDLDVVSREITEPARLLRERGVEATVTVYGSARILSPEAARAQYEKTVAEIGAHSTSAAGRRRLALARDAVRMSRYYRVAQELGALVATEGGGKVAIVTGGGPGIMEGANRGAFEAGGPSAGFNITLPHEQRPNPYATKGLEFTFENFATRKMALRHGAMGLVYFPGGFGTMDELFEVLTLMQTGKIPRTPIVLVGEKSYWERVLDFDEFSRLGLISPDDLSLFTFAETAEQAWSAIQRFHGAPGASAVAAARP
jgi:uncharacterized protein (TIGR00730 family)